MMKSKITNQYIRIVVMSWVVFGIAWVMPLRVMLMVKIHEDCLILKSLLNIYFNIGNIIEYNAKGIRIIFIIFGKGFEYCKYRHIYKDNELGKYTIKSFTWVK